MYILSIGTNQGDRIKNLTKALNLLDEKGEVLQVSSIYETPSWGYEGSPYLNICITWETNQESLSILEHLDLFQEMEYNLGRRRTEIQYTDRPIDIDIISYNNSTIDHPRLKIPHSNTHLRNFVLIPLAEICPNFTHPVFNKSIDLLLKECKDNGEINIYGKL